MIVVGEKINGMFKSIGNAIERRDPKVIQQMAIDQVKSGAHILDICPGPGLDNAPEVMAWMVSAVQEVTNVPLSIDSPDPETILSGLETAKNKTVINSTTAEKKKMDILFPAAEKYNAEIICLSINEKGIPNTASGRTELALQILSTAIDYGVSPDAIYLDPVVLPIGPAQDQAKAIFETLTMFKTLNEPPPKTIAAISNVSNATKERPLLNRTYLAMLMAYGLDAAILNPLDTELMNTLKAAEILLNKKLYCDSFLRA